MVSRNTICHRLQVVNERRRYMQCKIINATLLLHLSYSEFGAIAVKVQHEVVISCCSNYCTDTL